MFSLVAIHHCTEKMRDQGVSRSSLFPNAGCLRVVRVSEAEYDGCCAKTRWPPLASVRESAEDDTSSQTSSSQLQAGANPRTNIGRRIRGRGTRLATRFLPGRFGWLSIGRSHRGHCRRNKIEDVV